MPKLGELPNGTKFKISDHSPAVYIKVPEFPSDKCRNGIITAVCENDTLSQTGMGYYLFKLDSSVIKVD